MMKLFHIVESLLHKVWQDHASFAVCFFKRLARSIRISRSTSSLTLRL